nr:MAG TPA: hypothetical protein [Caudoviricetes sp.]
MGSGRCQHWISSQRQDNNKRVNKTFNFSLQLYAE